MTYRPLTGSAANAADAILHLIDDNFKRWVTDLYHGDPAKIERMLIALMDELNGEQIAHQDDEREERRREELRRYYEDTPAIGDNERARALSDLG
jgi:ABC-type cobalt transport system substrate-binding protein